MHVNDNSFPNQPKANQLNVLKADNTIKAKVVMAATANGRSYTSKTSNVLRKPVLTSKRKVENHDTHIPKVSPKMVRKNKFKLS